MTFTPDAIFGLVILFMGSLTRVFFLVFSKWADRSEALSNHPGVEALYLRFQNHARLAWGLIAVGAWMFLQELV